MRKIVGLFLLFFSISYSQPQIEIIDPWVRAVPPNAKNTALFMVIKNSGDELDTLTAVKTDIAKMVMIHKTVNEDGVMKMVHVHQLKIPPHSTVELKPGGYHIMIMGLKEPVHVNNMLKFTLIFKKSGKIDIKAPVKMK
ncbi:copper chaperone PCu(A)C [Persephonella atlantica]|uniref:Copper chaperone PCu(A)C n=1 Tax=Persephonella atlantica TaxID=2699429 RepID=A0ABS1GH97_9AQUI|nr:copper chaperone PCu(A)C [Persephonella atlantica]MBK3332287.1 copper chaperone PCu(A)C [Persephonella atlantica]